MQLPKLVYTVLFTVLMACSAPATNDVEKLKKKTDSLQQVIDSLESKVATDSVSVDTAVQIPGPDTLPPAVEKTSGIRLGKHAFTLQWISWDEPGSVTIQPSEDGWYSIEGGQKSRKNDDYISINGVIKQVSPSELLFKGEIKSVVATNNGGKPCIKTGSKIFKTTKNRQYWRLQDMINCEGGLLTDYVDIYF